MGDSTPFNEHLSPKNFKNFQTLSSVLSTTTNPLLMFLANLSKIGCIRSIEEFMRIIKMCVFSSWDVLKNGSMSAGDDANRTKFLTMSLLFACAFTAVVILLKTVTEQSFVVSIDLNNDWIGSSLDPALGELTKIKLFNFSFWKKTRGHENDHSLLALVIESSEKNNVKLSNFPIVATTIGFVLKPQSYDWWLTEYSSSCVL